MLFLGDCITTLQQLAENSIDSLVTDPPAGISFMNKEWDHHKGGREEWIAWLTSVMKECYRVVKPGTHGLVWAIPRTSHWTGTALENAGFEVRDIVTHLFGSGFPKSLDISKAIDNAAGAHREVIGIRDDFAKRANIKPHSNTSTKDGFVNPASVGQITIPYSAAAKQWQGFGTALKPAVEFWYLIRKPISEKTIAANVEKWGCGGLNIDGSRIGTTVETWPTDPAPQGRFPSHLLFDEEAAKMLDEQSGHLHGSGASRFFYIAKASKSDKGADNTHPTVKSTKLMEYLIKLITPPNGTVLDPFMGSGSTGVAAKKLGFGFMGIEQNEEYFQIAKKRLG